MGEEEEEKPGVKGILYNFSQWTSAHGIPHIATSKVSRPPFLPWPP